ncbi:MAG: hypothetical protein UY18_C0003G0031 [Microgenomates group bacterium GW2011_GWF2_47_9]|nr:MAG: hypothetical protein UY18_C0003G0031 [Microgenomates group bacterium GW2011_GWF2_47_9]
MNRLGRLARYYWCSLKADLKATIAYPSSFWMAFLSIPLWALVQIAFIETIYGQTGDFVGFSKYETYALYGTYKIVQSLTVIFFYVRLYDLAEKIRGSSDWSLDMMLLKPIDSQLFVTTGRFWLGSISSLVVGGAIFWYGLSKEVHVFSALQIFMYLFVILLAVVFLYTLYLIVQTCMFWLDYTQAGEYLWTFYQHFAKYPRAIYHGGVGMLVNVLLPITIMASLPLEYLLGRVGVSEAVYAFLAVAGLFVFGRWFWLRSIKNYSSFGS